MNRAKHRRRAISRILSNSFLREILFLFLLTDWAEIACGNTGETNTGTQIYLASESLLLIIMRLPSPPSPGFKSLPHRHFVSLSLGFLSCQYASNPHVHTFYGAVRKELT